MKNKESLTTCIRVCRDEKQIRHCQQRLHSLNVSITALSQKIALAGNAVRMKILLLLSEENNLCVCDLSEILGMTVPAVSQHLKKLREGGLIFPEQDGVTVYYHLATPAKPLLDTLFHLLGDPVRHEKKAHPSIGL